jgi:hypothetical protein
MKRSKILRTIIKYKGNDGKPNSYEIDFMTFEKYDAQSHYIFPDGNIELYPYKWYDIRRIYQIPSYWFLLLFNKLLKIQINKRNHKRVSIGLLVPIIAFINEVIKLFASI